MKNLASWTLRCICLSAVLLVTGCGASGNAESTTRTTQTTAVTTTAATTVRSTTEETTQNPTETHNATTTAIHTTTQTTAQTTTVQTTVATLTAWPAMPANTNANLQYFGYFHSDGFGTQDSYIEEIAALGNTNIVMINSAWNTYEALTDLEAARQHNLKAIITVHCLFSSGQVGEVGSCHLRSDWQDSWDVYQRAIQPYIDDGTIYAFYFDEPRWNGIVKDDFHTATRYIREQTGAGVMACMTAMDMGWSSWGGIGPCGDDYLKYCTDVMFDDYGDWDAELRRTYLETLKSKAPEDAWIWGCPRGFAGSTDDDGVRRMEEHIKGQYEEAVLDERYVGIVAFSYANGITEGDWGYGLSDFFDPESPGYNESIQQLYRQIGRAVINNEGVRHAEK